MSGSDRPRGLRVSSMATPGLGVTGANLARSALPLSICWREPLANTLRTGRELPVYCRFAGGRHP